MVDLLASFLERGTVQMLLGIAGVVFIFISIVKKLGEWIDLQGFFQRFLLFLFGLIFLLFAILGAAESQKNGTIKKIYEEFISKPKPTLSPVSPMVPPSSAAPISVVSKEPVLKPTKMKSDNIPIDPLVKDKFAKCKERMAREWHSNNANCELTFFNPVENIYQMRGKFEGSLYEITQYNVIGTMEVFDKGIIIKGEVEIINTTKTTQKLEGTFYFGDDCNLHGDYYRNGNRISATFF